MDNLKQNINPKTQKSKKQKIALVVLIVVVVLGITSAGWTLLIQPRFFPTIYWKTYKSEKSGFKVKYPRNYQFGIEVRTEFDRKYSPFFVQIEKESFSLKREEEYTTIRLSVYDNPLKLSPREWDQWANKNDNRLEMVVVEEEENNYLDSFKDTVVNGMPAIEFSFEEPVASHTLIYSAIILGKNDKIFDINYVEHDETPQDDKNNKDVFELFLKSLKIN